MENTHAHSCKLSSFSEAKHAANLPYFLPLNWGGEQAVPIRVHSQGSAGTTKQAVDLLFPTRRVIQFPRQDGMEEAEQEADLPGPAEPGLQYPCWVTAKLKEELNFHTLHPVKTTGAQIHPFKVALAGSRASWATTTTQ